LNFKHRHQYQQLRLREGNVEGNVGVMLS